MARSWPQELLPGPSWGPKGSRKRLQDSPHRGPKRSLQSRSHSKTFLLSFRAFSGPLGEGNIVQKTFGFYSVFGNLQVSASGRMSNPLWGPFRALLGARIGPEPLRKAPRWPSKSEGDPKADPERP